jgi:putative DNA methylase
MLYWRRQNQPEITQRIAHFTFHVSRFTESPMPKKLIEVALPLDAINIASAREKSIRHGHPSTLHLWWARRPLAACRAVLFASLVDDPSEHPERFPDAKAQDAERRRLFHIIEELVKWENSNNEQVLAQARAEILRATGGHPPPVLDPFCGGGSIPLEAQRLGLEAHGSDLNPVAVLITKALIEIPPRFAGQPPVNPTARGKMAAQSAWKGAAGLADDVRYYGQWMRDEAQRRIGHLYPKVTLPPEQGGGAATVIAWLWARTVTCPNPACGAQMPLVRSFALSTKPGKAAWVVPLVDRTTNSVHFRIEYGEPSAKLAEKVAAGTSVTDAQGKKSNAMFKCIICDVGIAKGEYIDSEADKGLMRTMPLAIVAQVERNRVYVSFDNTQLQSSLEKPQQYLAQPDIQQYIPTEPAHGTFASNAQGRTYGFKTFGDYFTPRQLVALLTFSSLVSEVREHAQRDAIAAGLTETNDSFGATAYANAIATYLGFGVSRMSDICNALCRWENTKTQVRNLFTRQAISMVWDFAEPNIFADAAGDFGVSLNTLVNVIEVLPSSVGGQVTQRDARTAIDNVADPLISTDPPYYGNVSYADLSDFFYIWLRRSLKGIYPELFKTVLVPKAQELVATPFRFEGNREKARVFFEEGMSKVFSEMRDAQHRDYPLTVYYAYKQSESDEDEGDVGSKITASTGWETMLEGLIRSGFAVTGTWPMRTELSNRPVASGANALASSIVLVCRPRPTDAASATRRDFLAALKRELPGALLALQHGNVAPVDLAQAAIGPGMAVFSRYSRVLESDGSAMRVRTALQLINQTLDEVLTAQEGEYDADTRWAVAWYEQYAHADGPFGVAETLSKAKNTAVAGLVAAGFLQSRGGKVRLLRRDELDESWNPQTDTRLTLWEVTQHLIHALDKTGEAGAARLLAAVGGDYGERARDLAYRLYTTGERKGWAAEALAYNSLVVAWPAIVQQAQAQPATLAQGTLFGG